MVHLHNFSKIKVKKKSQNNRNQGFSYYFCLMIEGSRTRSGSTPLTNGSGSIIHSTGSVVDPHHFVVDPHHFDGDPVSTYHPDADPDSIFI